MSSNPAADGEVLERLVDLGDLPMTIEAELDHTELSFLDVSAWAPGAVVKLPSSAGETISIFAGRVRIGAGEVLVVDGALTVRISDLLSMPGMPDSQEPSA